MKVCDVCGAFLVVGDTEKRMQSHLEGKQHQGFALIRRTIQEYKVISLFICESPPLYDRLSLLFCSVLFFLFFSNHEEAQKRYFIQKNPYSLTSPLYA
jgi:hypothetical protein